MKLKVSAESYLRTTLAIHSLAIYLPAIHLGERSANGRLSDVPVISADQISIRHGIQTEVKMFLNDSCSTVKCS